jgi:hypothetical protein
MANSAKQNPRNKVGRNSGVGPGGVTEIVPTERERRHGVPALGAERSGGWALRLGVGLGALAVLGAGVAALMARQSRQKRGLRGSWDRLVDRMG